MDFCMVLEQMEGTLAQLIKSRKGRSMAEGLVRSIIQQSVAGIAHVHSLSFVHGALSPDHILITTTGLEDYTSPLPILSFGRIRKDVTVSVKIAGFGHAMRVQSIPGPSDPQPLVGPYIAPELLVSPLAPVSFASDMWSLGVVAHETMTLRPTFPARGWKDLFVRWCSFLGPPSRGSSALETDWHLSQDPSYASDAAAWADKLGLSLSSVCTFLHIHHVPNLTTSKFAVARPLFGAAEFSDEIPIIVSQLVTWNMGTRTSASSLMSSAFFQPQQLYDDSYLVPPTSLAVASDPRPNSAPSGHISTSHSTFYTPNEFDSDTISLAPSYRSRGPLLHSRSTTSLPSYNSISGPRNYSPSSAGDLFARALNSDTPINASVQELHSYLRQLPADLAEQDVIAQVVRRKELEGAKHEFILLQCALAEKGSVWIRIERLEKVTSPRMPNFRVRFGSAGGTSSSSTSNSKPNDTVSLLVIFR